MQRLSLEHPGKNALRLVWSELAGGRQSAS